MSTESSRRYLEPYRAAVDRHGPGFEATLWGSREAQHLRFDVMIDLAGFEGCTIVDGGCGPGDFAARLLERQVPFERYLGIDAIDEMVETAARRGLDPAGGRVKFLTADLLDSGADLEQYGADFFTFSGTLNTMDDAEARRLVGSAFEAAAQGVVFNFLSDRCDDRWRERVLHPARRFDTVAWLDWALGLSPRVSFTQAYLDGHDATIAVQR